MLLENNKCSGCGACSVICPQECIQMSLNENGFLSPVVDEEQCLKCNLCNYVCPMLHAKGTSLDELTLYSAYAKSEKIRKESSSGGLACLLASHAIENDHGVCGVTYDKETGCAKHEVDYNKESIENIKGSKYLQSRNQNAFKEVVKCLKNDKKSRFTIFGTPCQISGMNRVLEQLKLRERVVLIDIFCHGVPSYFLWDKYLIWLEIKHKIRRNEMTAISFRDKSYSWHKYFMHITASPKIGEGGTEYVRCVDNDPFLKIFTMGVVNQESCFSCPYRNMTSADIRLGDYWGPRFKNDELGISMVLVNTEIGSKIFYEIQEKITSKKHDMTDRFGQQHTNYLKPKYYEASLQMLRDDGMTLKSIINLYESNLDRIKRTIKKFLFMN